MEITGGTITTINNYKGDNMKIITMKRLTMDGEPLNPDYDEDPNDWFCVIETEEEELVYNHFTAGEWEKHLWNEMVKHAGIPQGLAWGDDDIYAYIRPNEACPEVGEKYKDGDDDVWTRVE